MEILWCQTQNSIFSRLNIVCIIYSGIDYYWNQTSEVDPLTGGTSVLVVRLLESDIRSGPPGWRSLPEIGLADDPADLVCRRACSGVQRPAAQHQGLPGVIRVAAGRERGGQECLQVVHLQSITSLIWLHDQN